MSELINQANINLEEHIYTVYPYEHNSYKPCKKIIDKLSKLIDISEYVSTLPSTDKRYYTVLFDLNIDHTKWVNLKSPMFILSIDISLKYPHLLVDSRNETSSFMQISIDTPNNMYNYIINVIKGFKTTRFNNSPKIVIEYDNTTHRTNKVYLYTDFNFERYEPTWVYNDYYRQGFNNGSRGFMDYMMQRQISCIPYSAAILQYDSRLYYTFKEFACTCVNAVKAKVKSTYGNDTSEYNNTCLCSINVIISNSEDDYLSITPDTDSVNVCYNSGRQYPHPVNYVRWNRKYYAAINAKLLKFISYPRLDTNTQCNMTIYFITVNNTFYPIKFTINDKE